MPFEPGKARLSDRIARLNRVAIPIVGTASKPWDCPCDGWRYDKLCKVINKSADRNLDLVPPPFEDVNKQAADL
jgi:hypothetical protein